MTQTRWIFLNLETTGSTKPIFTVELAAKCMTGWDHAYQYLNHRRAYRGCFFVMATTK